MLLTTNARFLQFQQLMECTNSLIALTVSNIFLFTPALLRTHSFVFFAVHETLRIFLSPFISKASKRVFSFFLSVQVSQPYVASPWGDWKRETGEHGTKLQDWKMREKACMESQMHINHMHRVSKNVLPSTCYRPNLDIHNPITIIFDRSVTKKVRNQTMLCCPTSPVYIAYALPCEIKTQKTARWCIVCATQSNCCSAVDLLSPEPWPNTSYSWTHWLSL